MDVHENAQVQLLAHDSTLHAALLMDLLRIVQQIDPAAVQREVDFAARELHDASTNPDSPLQGRGSHNVLENRLAFLRSVQIRASAT